MMPKVISIAALLALLIVPSTASANPQDEVRAAFDQFVVAQNAHDIVAVGALLLDSPSFLWITRGTPIWGRAAALQRFESLYKGTWRLEPKMDELKITMLRDDVAALYAPIIFTIGPAGQTVAPVRFLMNQVLIKTVSGWKVASILPIPAPAP
jgi:ketosteroid isomerase-like protein